MTDRTDILQRIVNLRNTNGRSEAETFTMLARAERLMEAYRVEEAELALAEATGEIKLEIIEKKSDKPLSTGQTGRVRHKVQMCLYDLMKFTETRAFLRDNYVVFVGDRPDVEMAHYLTDMIAEAMDREYSNWRRNQVAVGSGAKSAFQTAMAFRINARLAEIRREREAKVQEMLPQIQNKSIKELTSTALIVVAAAEQKREAVDTHFELKHPRLGSARGFQYRSTSNSAGAAGHAAGNRVNFGRPMEGGSRAAIAAE